MNGYGLALAVITFFIIGIFHPIVIKAEYHLPGDAGRYSLPLDSC